MSCIIVASDRLINGHHVPDDRRGVYYPYFETTFFNFKEAKYAVNFYHRWIRLHLHLACPKEVQIIDLNWKTPLRVMRLQ